MRAPVIDGAPPALEPEAVVEAAPEPAVEVQALAAPPPAPPPGRRKFRLIRRLLASTAGPVAHYIRRYLQASVEHELREARAQLTALSHDMAGVQQRLDRSQQALDTLLLQQGAMLRQQDTLLLNQTALLGQQDGMVRQQDGLLRQQDGLLRTVDDMLPLQHALATQQGVLLIKQDALVGQQQAMLHRQDLATQAFHTVSDALTLQLNAVQAQGAQTAQDLVQLPGLFGPRFDELDIKQRPLVPYDDESMGIRMREGYVLAPRSSPAFVTMLANASSRGLEPGTRDTLMRLVQPGMTVADIGANIGLLTLVCATATGPSGRVVAFEPEAVPRTHLQKMIALNGLSWVEVRDQAVGAAPGRVTFNVSDIIGHSSLYALPTDEQARARTIEVEVVTMDKVLNGKRLDVAKIDVEGAELDVLEGMAKLIAANPDLAIVAEFGPSHLKRIGQTPARWFKAFAQAGFTSYIIDETTGDCAPCTAASTAKVVSANIAFVRPDGDAERRLLKA